MLSALSLHTAAVVAVLLGQPGETARLPEPGSVISQQVNDRLATSDGSAIDGQSPPPAGSTSGLARPVGAEATAGKIVRYAENLIRKHDVDLSGQLEEQEWRGVAGNPQEADLDHDGVITLEELVLRIVVYGRHRSLRLVHPGSQGVGQLEPDGQAGPATAQSDRLVTGAPAAGSPTTATGALGGSAAATDDAAQAERDQERARRSRKFFIPRDKLPAGIASWFIDRDADGDGQITMREYSASWSADVAAQFAAFDRNRDGVITAAESVAAPAKTKPGESTAAAAELPPASLPAAP